MNIIKFFSVFFLLNSLLSFSQEKKDCFLLENNNMEYSYTINEKAKKISLFSKKDDFMISFEVETKKDHFENIENSYRDYEWIIDNLTILHKDREGGVLELNTFKGMVFVLKTRCGYFSYTVKRRIIEECD